jgi:methyl-accepting chemotaxis protein
MEDVQALLRLEPKVRSWGKVLQEAVGFDRADFQGIETVIKKFGDMGVKFQDLDRKTRKKLNIAIESGNAEKVLEILLGKLLKLQSKKTEAKVDANTKGAEEGINRVTRGLNQIPKRTTASVQVNVLDSRLGALNNTLSEVTGAHYVDVYVRTPRGSPNAFEMIALVEKELLKLTGKKWDANLHVILGEEEGIDKKVASMLDKAKQLATDFVSAIQSAVGEKSKIPDKFLGEAKDWQKAVNERAKELEKMISKAEKAFDKIVSKAKEFRDAIKGGFATAGDLIGGALEGLTAEIPLDEEGNPTLPPFDMQNFLSNTLGGQQALAAGLAKLAAAGLAPALLSELASQGTSALPLINAILAGGESMIKQFNDTQKQIQEFARGTGELLAGELFGGKIKKAGNALERLGERVDKFTDRIVNQAQRLGLSLEHLGRAADELIRQLNQTLRRFAGQPGADLIAATGYHGTLQRDTLIQAHAGERVDIAPGGGGGGGGDVYVNVDVRGNAIYAKDLAEEVRSILLRDKRYKGALGLS